MSVVSRRRFIAAVAGAALVNSCGATPTLPPSTTAAPTAAATSAAQPTGAATPQAQPTGAATLSPAMEAAASLAAGEGEVTNVGGQAVAIYKDAQGNVTLLSPRCPHQGCQVAWNAADKTWDCPCHGSRFNADGSLKNGPANKGLTAAS
jgi:Rieske Fe-S protein